MGLNHNRITELVALKNLIGRKKKKPCWAVSSHRYLSMTVIILYFIFFVSLQAHFNAFPFLNKILELFSFLYIKKQDNWREFHSSYHLKTFNYLFLPVSGCNPPMKADSMILPFVQLKDARMLHARQGNKRVSEWLKNGGACESSDCNGGGTILWIRGSVKFGQKGKRMKMR